MSRRIVIDPVTRIEGHAKIVVQLDDRGEVCEARFMVAELRGFEKFCVGRPVFEMPGLTSRICGICPVSHLLASAKACDGLLGVPIPVTAEKLRRLMNLAQIVQSHALSFFHLSSPDLLLGMDAPPQQRNFPALATLEPELARDGIRLRQFGQQLIEALGGKRIHPAWAVAGGVRSGLADETRHAFAARLPEMLAIAVRTLARFRATLERFRAEVDSFGNFPGLFAALVNEEGDWEHYHGTMRFVDTAHPDRSWDHDPKTYREFLAEEQLDWSYLKFPYYRSLGFPDGSYRVGPLARLNVCRRIGTPRADEALQSLRERVGRYTNSSFFYHEARLIEILAALEYIESLLLNEGLDSEPLQVRAGLNFTRSVGFSEAPRGTLFHDYSIDGNGRLTSVNLLIATGQNNHPMNRALTQVARRFVRGTELDDGVLNRLEAGIRAFDPCLSCSTHAWGEMPLTVELRAPDDRLLDVQTR